METVQVDDFFAYEKMAYMVVRRIVGKFKRYVDCKEYLSFCYLTYASCCKKYTKNSGCSFQTFFYNRLYYDLIDSFRIETRKKVDQVSLDDDVEDRYDEPEEILNSHAIDYLFKCLNEEQVRLLRYKFYDGLKNIEIAEIINEHPATSSRRIQVILKKAKKILND